MGVAGVAMFGTIYCLIMSIVSVVRYFQWKRVGVLTTGVIGAQKGAPRQQKDFSEYIYDFTIHYKSEQISKIYTERVQKGKHPRVTQGSIINIYWNSADGSYIELDRLKNNMRQYPIACIVCILVFAICCFLSLTLSR